MTAESGIVTLSWNSEMLFKTFFVLGVLSIGLFTVASVTGMKGPTFGAGGAASSGGSGGRSSGGYFPVWFGGK
jgi:hypothetical protein